MGERGSRPLRRIWEVEASRNLLDDRTLGEEMLGLNVGSGERPFKSTPDLQWINVDKIEREGQDVDIVCDGARLPYDDESVDFLVLHHCLEHEGLGDGKGLIQEAYRVLRIGGSLLIFIPDIRALALRWLEGGISDYIYVVNLMGAYHGSEADRHRWHYTKDTLPQFLRDCAPWFAISNFDWRTIPGGDFARDFWIMAMEARK